MNSQVEELKLDKKMIDRRLEKQEKEDRLNYHSYYNTHNNYFFSSIEAC